MTFLEIAQFVCEGPEFIDGVEAGRVKERLKREYRLIWDSFTWKDSQLVLDQTITPYGTDPSAADDNYNTVIANPGSNEVDFPISGRWNENNEITVADTDYLFRLGARFDTNTGTPTCFTILPRTAAGLVQVRLYPYPNIAGDVTFLVKRKLLASELLDTATPVLRGVENVLIAMGEAHLFMRANDAGRAQEAQARAADRIRVMKDMETNQQASVQRIVPVEDRYDFHYPGENRTKGYW